MKLAVWTAILLGFTSVSSIVSVWHAVDPSRSSRWDRLAGYSLSSAGCACLVLLLICLRESAYTRWMRIAPLQYLGKISYGVYLLHPIAYWIMIELIKKHYLHFKNDDPVWFAETVALSLALAVGSWELFEMPLLRLKNASPTRVKPRSRDFRRESVPAFHGDRDLRLRIDTNP